MIRFLARSVTTQIALLLVVCVTLFHLAVSSVIVFGPRFGISPRTENEAAVVALATLAAAPAANRSAVIAAIDRSLPALRLAKADSAGAEVPISPMFAALRAQVPANIALAAAPDAPGQALTARLTDGEIVRFDFPRAPGGLPIILLVTIGFIAVSLAIFSAWAARVLIRPMARFANAAEAFTFDAAPAPLDETGPDEVRVAAQAFNRMQVRISDLAARQARMLAAISHDLRTPITRMRMRAEFLDESTPRTLLVRDLEQMDSMVHACLSFLRGSARRQFGPVNLASVLQTVIDGYADMGHDVDLSFDRRVVVEGDAENLERVFGNLVDNAVKYGVCARVTLDFDAAHAIVDVRDEGPGIPAQQRDAMLQPFERGDESRNPKVSSSFGLGLAIVQEIVQAHGGTLTLMDAPGGGLIARVRLPTADTRSVDTIRNTRTALAPTR